MYGYRHVCLTIPSIGRTSDAHDASVRFPFALPPVALPHSSCDKHISGPRLVSLVRQVSGARVVLGLAFVLVWACCVWR